MALSVYQFALVAGMLITGSINTLSKKAQNDCRVKGIPYNRSSNSSSGEEHEFDHPWFQTIIMFLGESFCLIGLIVSRYRERSRHRRNLYLSNIQGDGERIELKQPRIFQFVFLLPTLCDLIGTTLAGIGLLYVTASVWQMLRGSLIIFTGIFSRVFLKRKLRWYHWTGMIVTVMGLLLVGSASIFEDQTSNGVKETILGFVFILAGQASNALQMVVEETFLKNKNYPPLQVVGMEGTFGFIIMAFIVLPILYFIPDESQFSKRYEDTIDALYQIANSPKLLAFCLLYLFSITFYNYCGLAVTKSLTAVHRTLIDACRTIVVWVVDLIIFYAFGGSFGEAFNTTYGLLQIDGFMFLLIGTALYNNLFDLSFLPCLREQSSQRNAENSQAVTQAEEAKHGTDDERAPLLQQEVEIVPQY